MLVKGLILATLTGRIITNCFVSKSDYLSCMLTNQDMRYDANDITHINNDYSIRDVLLSKTPIVTHDCMFVSGASGIEIYVTLKQFMKKRFNITSDCQIAITDTQLQHVLTKIAKSEEQDIITANSSKSDSSGLCRMDHYLHDEATCAIRKAQHKARKLWK